MLPIGVHHKYDFILKFLVFWNFSGFVSKIHTDPKKSQRLDQLIVIIINRTLKKRFGYLMILHGTLHHCRHTGAHYPVIKALSAPEDVYRPKTLMSKKTYVGQ